MLDNSVLVDSDFEPAHWAERGTVRHLTGHRPMRLDDPERAWVVLTGGIDILLTETSDGTLGGPHYHLFALEPGDILFGVETPDGGEAVSLVASGLAGTSVAEVELELIRALSGSETMAAVIAGKVDRWAGAVTEALTRPLDPRPAVTTLAVSVAPGGARSDAFPLPPNLRLGPLTVPVWLTIDGAVPQFLDLEELPESQGGVAFPLYPGGWLSVPEPVAAAIAATAEVVEEGRCWAGLKLLNRFLLTLLPLNLRVNAVDELNRQHSRRAANLDAARRSFEVMSEILAPPDGLSAAAIEGRDPVADACAAIAAAMGFEAAAMAPERGSATASGLPVPALEQFLRANSLRSREIVLESGWWHDDVPPFLLFRQHDQRPLAVLPGPGQGYRLFDPFDRTETVLTAETAPTLGGTAVTFYQSLPFESLTGAAIARLVFGFARPDLLAVVGLGLIAGLLGMAPPMATGYLVETAIPSHDWDGLWTMGIILAVLAAALFLVRLVVQVAALRIEGRAGTRLQAGVFDRLLRLPTSFCKDFSAGDLMIRTMAIQRIQMTITGSTITALLNGVLGVFAIALMAWYDLRLGAVALLPVIVFCLFAAAIGWLRMRCEHDVMSLTSAVTSLTLQLAVGISKLRLGGAEDRVFFKWSRLYAKLAGRRYLVDRLDALVSTVSGSYGLAATTAIFAAIWFWSGQPEGTDGKAGVDLPALGTLLAFLSAYSLAFTNISALVTTAIQMAALAPVYRHAAPILEAVPETDGTKADPGVLSGALELSHVDFRYGAELPPIFSGFSLSVAAGEFVAFVGPSGCGKSTLLRLLLGFETPTSGAVLYDGADLRGLDLPSVRRQLGVVMQNGKLMPGSLLENILGANVHLSEENAWRAAEQAGLAEDIRAMPMGMQTVVTEGGAFSGGQVQRVLIARAIIARPRILLLDEATSALDNHTQAIVTASLDHLAVTRIVIAHRLSTVINAHRIIVLDRGHVAQSGHYQDLIAADGPFARLARRQLV
ncbi:MAG: NHLP bacteriocin export ABC transporter permease/ATPase subunit [Rhodospirillaceae bacterium]